MPEFSHFDESGASRMVDVSDKPVTWRVARAEALVVMAPATLDLIQQSKLAKGDVLEVARLAGIMASKKTSDLIPLCHVLPLDTAEIGFEVVGGDRIRVEATMGAHARTGVEMEALTAASVAALTIYDMCKAVDRGMEIAHVRLLEKSGGRSDHFVRES